MAAANATLDILTEGDCYERLESSSAMLERGLADAAGGAGLGVTINRVGSIMSCFFTPPASALRSKTGGVRNFADVQSTDIKRFKKFFTAMLKQGIYLAPSAYEAMFISLAHSAEDIEKTIEAARSSFAQIK